MWICFIQGKNMYYSVRIEGFIGDEGPKVPNLAPTPSESPAERKSEEAGEIVLQLYIGDEGRVDMK